MARTSIFASILCLLICQQASSIDKGGLLSTYRNKFVVARKEGLSTYLHQGLLSGTLKYLINEAGQAERPKLVGGGANGGNASSFPWSAAPGRGQIGCGIVQIRKGGVVKVSHVSLSGRLLDIDLTVPPKAVQCVSGIVPPSAPAVEMGSTELAIQASNGAGVDIPDALSALAAQWLTPFDKADDAASFGDALTQVKSGMTFADVEKALGAPQTRVDSGDKVLYRYKDITVEFQDGKVTDVR